MIGGSSAVTRTAKTGKKSYVMSDPKVYATRHLKLAPLLYIKEPVLYKSKVNDFLLLLNIFSIYTCV